MDYYRNYMKTLKLLLTLRIINCKYTNCSTLLRIIYFMLRNVVYLLLLLKSSTVEAEIIYNLK